MTTANRQERTRDPRWVREALYAARPSRRPLGRELDDLVHELQLDMTGGRFVPAFDL